MRIVTFNVNSVRARIDPLLGFIDQQKPDVLGLQEIKSQDADFPLAPFQQRGYHCLVHGQKTHHGVATLTKQVPKDFKIGLPFSGEQARIIYAEITKPDGQPLHIFNIYFPNGEERAHPVKFPYKGLFYKELYTHITNNFSPKNDLLIMGDFNIAPTDLDIGIGEANRLRWLRTGKCSFLPEERAMLQPYFDFGLIDVYRTLNPDLKDIYSWFDIRSRGFEDNPKRGLRIDYALVTPSLSKACVAAKIDYDLRAMERPSDHCPVLFDFTF